MYCRVFLSFILFLLIKEVINLSFIIIILFKEKKILCLIIKSDIYVKMVFFFERFLNFIIYSYRNVIFFFWWGFK